MLPTLSLSFTEGTILGVIEVEIFLGCYYGSRFILPHLMFHIQADVVIFSVWGGMGVDSWGYVCT